MHVGNDERGTPVSFAVGYSLDEARLLLALATAAYIDEKPLPNETVQAQTARMRKDINTALESAPTGGWQVAWGPGLSDDRANMLYVAGNIVTNQYAVAIRGTDWSFWLDWVEDFASLLPLVPFPFLLAPFPKDVEVAIGTLVGLEIMRELTGLGPISNTQPVTLQTFLESISPSADIFVTGHSLGGCLASVTAAWLASMFLGASRLKVYTFAGPSAGNGQFASYYNTLFTDATTQKSTAYRLYNTLDAIPNAWASLPTIETYYQPAPLCPDYVKDIISDAVDHIGKEYTQVGTAGQGSAIALPGTVVPWWSWWDLDPTGTVPFAHQVAVQHHPATYLSLLDGTTPISAASMKLQAMGARVQARRAAAAVAPTR